MNSHIAPTPETVKFTFSRWPWKGQPHDPETKSWRETCAPGVDYIIESLWPNRILPHLEVFEIFYNHAKIDADLLRMARAAEDHKTLVGVTPRREDLTGILSVRTRKL
jgi:hypothetical protein